MPLCDAACAQSIFGVESGLTDIFLYQPLDRLHIDAVALFADKQCVRVLLVRLQAFGQILLERGKTRIIEKYRPLLAALTEHAHGIRP